MTEFEKTYQNYNPRQAALDEARALLTAAAKAAMADGTLPEAELPAFIVEIPADVKNGDIASNLAMAGARTWRKAPRMIAEALLAHLPDLTDSVFAKVEIAGPRCRSGRGIPCPWPRPRPPATAWSPCFSTSERRSCGPVPAHGFWQ